MLQADPEKYYHVFTAGEFPTWDWERGEWTTFEVKPEYVSSISQCYNSEVHKAPLWIGHPWYSGAPAEGWIAKSRFEGNMLYNSFDWIDENFVKAVREKKYQYVSCEFGRVMGIDNDYQIALGATNLPRVSGQKPLEFEGQKFSMAKGHSVYAPIPERLANDIVKDFSASSKKYFFQNQNNKSMNEFLKRIALLFAIDLSKHDNDEAVTSQITEKIASFNSEKTALESEVNALKDERIKFALDQATREGRLKPAERDTYESLLKGNYEAARKALFNLPVDTALKTNVVPSGGSNISDPTNSTEDKFSNEDGSKMTYAQALEKITADPGFAKKFTDEELASLPGADMYYKR